MDLYSRFLIQFIYALQNRYRRIETFAFSTSLQRISDALHSSSLPGARAVAWLNPLMGNPDFRPETAALKAALPHLDLMAPAHNVAALRDLVGKLASLRPSRRGSLSLTKPAEEQPLTPETPDSQDGRAAAKRPTSGDRLMALARGRQQSET